MRRFHGSAVRGATFGALNLVLACLAGEVMAQEAQSEAAPPVAEETPTEAEAAPAADEATADAEAPEAEAAAEGEEADAAPVEEPAEEPVPAPAEEEPAAEEASAEASGDAARIAALEEKVAELATKAEEAEMAALLAEPEAEMDLETFRIYGFMDMGYFQEWSKNELFGALWDMNVGGFVVGNIDLYFDFQPHDDWRGLAEVRFSNAPHGTYDLQSGTRENTFLFDPAGTVSDQPMWTGSVVIERAWIEWQRFQQLRIRVGNFFTPFGIWNVDHGQPTLIASTMPQFLQQQLIPLRQTGIQALGSVFIKDWEWAYRVWLSNGRGDISVKDLSNDKAFGARTFLRKEGGTFSVQVGGSFHHGRERDRNYDLVFDAGGLGVDVSRTFDYTEDIFGADLSVNYGDTRLRAEYTARLKRYNLGYRPTDPFSPVGGSTPDHWTYSVYGLLAHQLPKLPWFAFEPFVAGEYVQMAQFVGDTVAVELSPGLNIRFNPSAMIKTQYTHTWFVPPSGSDSENIPDDGIHHFTTRVVLAF